MASRWYQSLYWRIALGFVLTLAAMLVVQAMLFVWVLSRGGPRLPGEPDRFAETVAADLGQALDKSVQTYNKAMGSYTTRVLPTARRFKELGIISDKDLPALEPIEVLARPPAAGGDQEGVT